MAKRRPSKNEAAPPLAAAKGEPRKPVLCDRASEIWDDYVAELRSSQVLARTDGYLLASLCKILAEIETTQDFLDKNGYTITMSENGNGKLRAEVRLLESLEKRAIKLTNILGLSPQARKQLRINLQKNGAAKDPCADLS